MARLDLSFWRGRRVLLTGHTGFKGAWLSLWLERLGASVFGFSLPGTVSEPALFELARVGERMVDVRGDVRDQAALLRAFADAEPEIVIHMAAQSLVRRGFALPFETYETNVMGTLSVLEAVRATGSVEATVVVTTDKCYENREWEWGYREDDPLGGRDPYSSSKACAELVVSASRSSFALRVATARAGNVIGGGDFANERLLPDLMRSARTGEKLRLRNPHAVRPWQHVLNPLQGYLMLAQALFAEPSYACAWNFGPADADARPVGWIADRAVEQSHGPAWELDTSSQPPEAGQLRLDSSRARTLLGWGPGWDLEQGLRATTEWHQAFDAGGDAHALTLAQIQAYSGGA